MSPPGASNSIEVMNVQKMAHLFPGQGIQKVGMGKYFSRTVENLLMAEDPKLLEVAWVGPQEELNKTINAQPTITLMQVSLAEDLDKPDLAVGHSLGNTQHLGGRGLEFAILVQGCKSTWILHARTLPRWVANCLRTENLQIL